MRRSGSGGGNVLTVPCDVGVRGDVRQAIEIVMQHFGRIDMLINNAGVIQVGPLEHMTSRRLPSRDERAFLGRAPLHRSGASDDAPAAVARIINIASIGGLIAVPHLAPYTASKFALVGYSDAVRAEVAKDGIRVTTVCPGLMRTGSAVNALVKGRHEAEFAWFAALSSLPLVSIDARRAATEDRRGRRVAARRT